MEAVAVVTAFVRHEGEVLAVRRAEDAPLSAGQWDGVSREIEDDEDPVDAALRGITDAVGIGEVGVVRVGEPLDIDEPDADAQFVVHPVLLDAADRTTTRSADVQDAEWLPPTELLRRDAVPHLFDAYQRVSPTVQSVAADAEHGAAALSIRALEVLRDRAGQLAAAGEEDVDELAYLADRLRKARPSMAVLRNRVNRAMAEAAAEGGAQEGSADTLQGPSEGTPAGVEAAAIEGISRALAADAEAAMRAAGTISGWHVLTLSRSGTVLDALQADTIAAISIAESRPACEGTDVAGELASAVDAPVTVHTDAAIAHRLATEPIDAVVVGADTVLPDGSVVNKTGTRTAAIVAAREDVPVYAVAATDKITTRDAVNVESGERGAVYDGDAALDVLNPTFDVTPADLIAGVITERGVLDADGIAEVAAELRALEPA